MPLTIERMPVFIFRTPLPLRVGNDKILTQDEAIELSRKGILRTDGDSVVILISQPTATIRAGKYTSRHAGSLRDELIRMYAPMLLRPWGLYMSIVRKHPPM